MTITRFDKSYMKMAKEWGTLSVANRKKVGCLIVKKGQIISDGFNGSPRGFPNECEGRDGETLAHVLHAESNAVTKLAKSTNSSEGAVIYVTLSPCFECAKLIIQAEISRVVCGEKYRVRDGIKLLRKAGIVVEFID